MFELFNGVSDGELKDIYKDIKKGYGNTWENGNEIDEFHRFICKNGNNRRTT